MKSLLLMVSFLSVMSFTTCSKDYVPNYIEEVFIHIKEAENVLKIYDKSVQEALDNDESGVIPSLSNNAKVAITIKTERIQELPTNREVADLQKSALDYLEAMSEMIKAEEVYKNYSDSTTLEEARQMDAHNVKARANLESKHSSLMNMKEQMEVDLEK